MPDDQWTPSWADVPTTPPPFENGKDHTTDEAMPPGLGELWGKLGSRWQLRINQPWNPKGDKGFEYRPVAKICLRELRRRGWTLDQAIALADRFPEGLGRFLDAYADLYDELWKELEEEDKAKAEAEARAKAEAEAETDIDGIPRSMTLAAFLASAKPPEFLIDPILQRGFLYTLTAPTFHGKTTTLIYLCLCLATGKAFASHATKRGRIVYFAGENPDDIAQKFIIACDFWGLDPASLPISIIPGAFDLAGNLDASLAKAAKGGPLAGVAVDTSAAYRYDDDEDNNQASKLWAQNLRQFTRLDGKPAVIVPAHPIKHADRTSLLPRGGGGFLNEVDGNLTLWADLDAGITELHWQGKFRGPSFEPIRFDLRKHPHPTWRHSDGRPVEMVAAVPSGMTARTTKFGRVEPLVQKFHSALLDAIILGGKPGETTREIWVAECIRRDLIDPPEADDSRADRNRKKAKLRAAKSDLLAAGWIGIDGERVFNLRQ